MDKQQYRVVRRLLRESAIHNIGLSSFPEDVARDDARRLLDLRNRCDMLAVRQWAAQTATYRSPRERIMRTAPGYSRKFFMRTSYSCG